MVPRLRIILTAFSLAAAALPSAALRAADLGALRLGSTVGVPCESPEVQAFPSVWLGHFDGGYSHYLGPGRSIVLDWRDEKLCFPSARSCGRYISSMRRAFHRPEGYFTCLPIR